MLHTLLSCYLSSVDCLLWVINSIFWSMLESPHPNLSAEFHEAKGLSGTHYIVPLLYIPLRRGVSTVFDRFAEDAEAIIDAIRFSVLGYQYSLYIFEIFIIQRSCGTALPLSSW